MRFDARAVITAMATGVVHPILSERAYRRSGYNWRKSLAPTESLKRLSDEIKTYLAKLQKGHGDKTKKSKRRSR